MTASSLSYRISIQQPKTVVKSLNNDLQQIVLKTYPELNLASLRLGYDITLVTWYQLKYLDTTSDGFISFKSALKGLQKYFGYSKQTAYNLLNDGQLCFEIFRNKRNRKTIRLFGLKTVALNFKVYHYSLAAIIEVNKETTRQTYRGLLFDTYFKDVRYNNYKQINPLDRQTIEDETGIDTRTQQRYNKVAQTVVRPNYSTDIAKYKSKRTIHYCAKQLPNTFVAHSEKVLAKGQLHKINRALNVEVNSVLSISGEALRTKQPKRYFTSQKSLCQTKKRNPDYFVKRIDLIGYTLWSKGVEN